MANVEQVLRVLRRWKRRCPQTHQRGQFHLPKEAQILTERWRVEYNTERPHSALGYKPPAPQAFSPKQPGYGDVENKERFPHPHTPGYDYGQMSKEALH